MWKTVGKVCPNESVKSGNTVSAAKPQKERTKLMRVVIQENYDKMCKWAADYIAAK
jgi:hypothetical protein